MASMCRVLFVSILVASAVSTARAEAHMNSTDKGDMPTMSEEIQKIMDGMGKMMECMSSLATECPQLAMMMADDESSPDASSYPATEEEFNAICGDECKPAITGLSDCIKDATAPLAGLMESGSDDMKVMEDGMKQMDDMVPMIEETCSTCAWDDHACMDTIEAKYAMHGDFFDEEPTPAPTTDESSSKATSVSAALVFVASVAFLMI